MAAVQPSARSSYFSYINPLNILRIPAYLYRTISAAFRRNSHPQPPRLNRSIYVRELHRDDEKEVDGFVWPDGITGYFNEASRAYPTVEFRLSDGSMLKIARTWLSDIERLGEPDEFYINGEKIEKAPKTDEEKKQILEKLRSMAMGDEDIVREWTEIWSYRPKMTLLNELMEKFKEQFKLNPILGRNGYKKVVISLDTKKSLLVCQVSGQIEHATDDNSDLFDKRVRFEAGMTYNSEEGWVENHIVFFED